MPPGTIVASAFPREAFDNIADTAITVHYLPVWDVIQRGGLAGPLFARGDQAAVLWFGPLRLMLEGMRWTMTYTRRRMAMTVGAVI